MIVIAAAIAIAAVWVFVSKGPGKEKYTDRRSYVTRIDLGKFAPFKNDKRQCPLGYTNNPASTGAANACKKRILTVKKQRIRWIKK